jgi:hypothetical protein
MTVNVRPRVCGIFVLAGLCAALVGPGCRALGHSHRINPGEKYLDARQPSGLNTVGIESSDLRTACQEMVAKLLANPIMNNSASGALIFTVDESDFDHNAHTNFDTTTLVDLVRTELFNAANGKVRIVSRNAEGPTLRPDFELGGRITDLYQSGGSRTESYTQIAFEVTYLKSNEIVFSDLHSFKKAGAVERALY